MIYFIINVLAILSAIVVAFIKQEAFVNAKKYFQKMAIMAFSVGLISGIIQGTHYTHVINFYWWMFSVFSFVVIMLVSTLIICVGYIKRSISK